MKSQLKERIDNLLDSAKLKRTKPRRMVLEVLLNAAKPQTADEIVSAIGKTGPNRVTVYRTLENMVVSGLVHKAFVGERSQYYELADKCTNISAIRTLYARAAAGQVACTTCRFQWRQAHRLVL